MDIATIISVLSFTVSAVLAILHFHDRRKGDLKFHNDYINGMLSWYFEVIKILIRLNAYRGDYNREEREMDLCSLSAFIERGRFFFPNINRADGYGNHKPLAYQGYRNLVLEFLVRSYDLLRLENHEYYRDHLTKLHRQFTSSIFEIVRPEKHLAEIRKITDKFYAPNKTIEDFIESGDSSVFRFLWEKRDV